MVLDQTVEENIALALDIANFPSNLVQSRLDEVLKLVNLTSRRQLFPSQLSGGELQRASLARAIAINPDLILADEPTGNLDSRTGDEIIGLFRKLNESLMSTIIMVTHDERIAHAAKRIIRLFDGLVVEDIRN